MLRDPQRIARKRGSVEHNQNPFCAAVLKQKLLLALQFIESLTPGAVAVQLPSAFSRAD
jgi:hypothetical protein